MPARKEIHDIYHSLIEVHGNRLYRLCLKLTYSVADAEDLFSETILKVFEKPDKILSSPSGERFLFQTASYLFLDKKRLYARRRRLVPVVPLSESEGDVVADSKDVSHELIKRETHDLLHRLIEELPEKFKVVLVFYYTMELSVNEIAEILRVPNGTVMSRLKRGREKLKKALMEAGYDETSVRSI